ncbi:MAG: hypothetical protein QN178_09395 [Armatimonadota bacterium]|nr:hypothetical protein [Armatimonadota bacterium]
MGRAATPTVWPWVLWGVGALVVAGGLVAADRRWQAATTVDPGDPAVRVAGAVRSISGSHSVRRTEYDAAAKAARVEATSQYYDARKTVEENREYLATEGRLAAQLALHQDAAVGEVTIRLFARRTLLATVTARQGQTYDEMKVEYSGPLVPP